MPKILVTGGAGYIGSHTLVDLIEHGFEVVSIDNFSRSSSDVFKGIEKITGVVVKNYPIDLCDHESVRRVFLENRDLIGIIHFAAYKSVPESIEFPMRYYENNMNSLFNILKCAEEFNIAHFVFSSSCSVYGNVESLPVTENTPLAKPECAYAASKQMGEQVIADFSRVSSGKYIALRYFNPVGAHSSSLIGENPIGIPNNLIPLITRTAAGLIDQLTVWGGDYQTRDGSCVRDFIHVMDIAKAHTLALEYMLKGKIVKDYEIFNLGTGEGVTVLEAIHSFEKVSGIKLNYIIGPRRAGDVMAIYADNQLVRSRLGWAPLFDLDNMMLTAWQWQQRLGEKAG
ncbi:MAG: UDP-glucose 4-epimerase GalE [Chitinophagaceae bacterium]|nr:UDP-glucose 4-epimerase GalE [Chitinophagaceae bacterium]